MEVGVAPSSFLLAYLHKYEIDINDSRTLLVLYYSVSTHMYMKEFNDDDVFLIQ